MSVKPSKQPNRLSTISSHNMAARSFEDTTFKAYPVGGSKCSVCGSKVKKGDRVHQHIPQSNKEYIYCPNCITSTAMLRARLIGLMNKGR